LVLFYFNKSFVHHSKLFPTSIAKAVLENEI